MDATVKMLLSVKDAAKILGVSPRHFIRMVDSGRAPARIRLGRTIRFSASEIDQWVSNGCKSIRQTTAGDR